MTTEQTRVDLVLPVYNEERGLEASVGRLTTASRAWTGYRCRIVVVDNASTDRTAVIGVRLASESDAVEFRRLERKGRGRALSHAWTETDAELSLYMDIDLSTDLAAVPEALGRLSRGADLVTGSRLDAGSQTTRGWQRELLSRGYNLLVRGLFPQVAFDDAQCGFKGVRVAAIRPLLPKVENRHWFFDTELLVLATYHGLRVESFPVVWIDDPDTSVNVPKTVLEDLKGLARLRRTLGSVLP